MKIITKNNIVKYIGDGLQLTKKYIKIAQKKYDYNIKNAKIYDIVDMPEGIEPNYWTYDGTEFSCTGISEQKLKERITKIKQEANRRILKLAPEWKQRNMLARGLELQSKGPLNWTSDEQREMADLRYLWTKISAIRKKSNELEAQVESNPEVPENWEG